MKLFFYYGEPGNIGRFGQVRRGDPLLLTEKEANSVADDKQFKPGKGDKLPEFKASVIPEKETPEQRAAREADDAERKHRWEKIGHECSPIRMRLLELRDMTWHQLLDKCAAMRITVHVRSSRENLINHILANSKV